MDVPMQRSCNAASLIVPQSKTKSTSIALLPHVDAGVNSMRGLD